jgi:acetyl-CoA acetyltransferase
MSNIPLIFTKEFTNVFGAIMAAKTFGAKFAAFQKLKLAYLKPRVGLMEGLTDPFVGINMGQTAEILAKEFGISREEQDKSMSIAQLGKNIQLGKQTKLYPIDLWGGEWWYWRHLEGDTGPGEAVELHLTSDI